MNPAQKMQHERFRFKDASSLRRKAAELGIDLPFTEDISPLLEPIEIAGRTVANRITIHPMEGCDGLADGSPNELTFRRYRRFASGGAGLVWFEATAVVHEGRANPRQLCIREDNVGTFAQLVSDARRAGHDHFGPSHDPVFILQLTHSGRYARPHGEPDPVLAHHNPALDRLGGIAPDLPLITDDALDRLQDKYVRAAKLAALAGFDGVDVKACHGYLVSELLASFTRDGSRYGGTFDNRTRFLREVVQRIGDEVPGVFVTSRMNAYDGIPSPYGFGCDDVDPPDPLAAEPIELAVALKSLGCPVINITAGNPYYRPHHGRPFDKPLVGLAPPEEHPLVGVNRLINVTSGLQRAVPDLPVIGTGYSWLRQFFPNVSAAVVGAGRASLIGLGRLGFAYPDAARDLIERDGLDPKKVCIACSSCSQIMRDGGCSGCIVRDAEVYVPEYRRGRQRARERPPNG